jgi:Zn-dependent peptidase ImmA (M78 family)
MAQKIQTIGGDPGLRFEIKLRQPAGHDPSMAWGDLRLFLDNEAIWESESDSVTPQPKPVKWTWIELLEYLGKWWPWLCLEEDYPIPELNPLYPADLQKEAERRWIDMDQDRVDLEEMAVYRYHLRHDLSSALNGCYLASLLIKRQGEQFILSSASLGQSFVRPKDEVIDTLTAIGDFIAEYLNEFTSERSRRAVSAWQKRTTHSEKVLLDILSGLDQSEREDLAGTTTAAEFWEWDPQAPFQDTEILAAARMSKGIIPSGTRSLLLQRIKEQPRNKTTELDRLSRSASKAFEEIGKPFAQGYWLAQWLRNHMSQSDDTIVDPEQLLRTWNVGLVEEKLPDASIDALAVWGKRHGPSILLNSTEPAKPTHPHGKRTTLAHEICHLLIDRDRALPLGEILGGRVAEHAEKRARAFAAELLLPRKIAASTFRHAESLQATIDQLKNKFQVSEELIAWQLRNASDITLSTDESTILNRITGDDSV